MSGTRGAAGRWESLARHLQGGRLPRALGDVGRGSILERRVGQLARSAGLRGPRLGARSDQHSEANPAAATLA
eukprot:2495352-Pyramimonas_sp.AAC.1